MKISSKANTAFPQKFLTIQYSPLGIYARCIQFLLPQVLDYGHDLVKTIQVSSHCIESTNDDVTNFNCYSIPVPIRSTICYEYVHFVYHILW